MGRSINPNPEIVQYSSWQLVKDLLVLLKPYRWRFLIASLIRLLGDIAALYPAYAFAEIITMLSKYPSTPDLKRIWLLLGLLGLSVVIRNLSQFFSKYLGYIVSESVAVDTFVQTIKHMFALDMSWHEKENSGNKIKRIQNAADGLNKIIRLWFNSIIEIIVNLVGIGIIMYTFNTTVLLMMFGFVVTYFTLSYFLTKRAGYASYYVNAQEETVNGIVFEAINNIRTLKVMGMAKKIYQYIVTENQELVRRLKRRVAWYQSRFGILNIWTTGWKLSILVFIILGVSRGHFEIGFLILFNSYFNDFRMSIDELSTATQDFTVSRFSVARMKIILEEPVTVDNEVGKKPLPQHWKKITIQNVSFAYGDNKVLNNISFEVSRGEKVGIVGLSGAGKSTLFKLLLKEREGFSGDIMFDDVSIKNISKSDYFKYVSVVLQDTEVFNFSLKDNITVTQSGDDKKLGMLENALKISHTADFVSKLPEGVNTLIGEKGVKLSGGERQRLGIARAIYKQPQLLLLDEATSHLDMESEAKIQDSLHTFFDKVTAVVIAHRLSTVKQMDKILVLENGCIIESGNFEDLYKAKGRFYELWEKQKI